MLTDAWKDSNDAVKAIVLASVGKRTFVQNDPSACDKLAAKADIMKRYTKKKLLVNSISHSLVALLVHLLEK